jgi:hypothetical protein
MTEILEILERIWTNLLDRPDGPLALRFYLQPAMAMLLGIRDGLADARNGHPPYFWSVLTDSGHRGERLREGIAATGKILIIALALDVVYQAIVLRTFHPGEALIVAFALAFLPYLLIRGPVERIAAWRKRSHLRAAAGMKE